MPTFILVFCGFASGWVIGAVLATQGGLIERHYKGLLGFIAFLTGVIVFLITFGEAVHRTSAFQIEEALVEQRCCVVLLWMLAGFAVYPFRDPIKRFLVDLTALTLRPPKSNPAPPQDVRQPRSEPKADQTSDAGAALQAENVAIGGAAPPASPENVTRDVDTSESKYLPFSLPLSVEAGIFATIIIVALLALNPKMLQGLTSFKAGLIEAHFATAGPILQKGQVAVTDANRKSVFKNWVNFDIADKKFDKIYIANVDQRSFSRSFAIEYLNTQLKPIFNILYHQETSYHKFNAANFDKLRDFSMRLANLIESNLDPLKTDPTAHSAKTQVSILKKVALETLVFKCSVDLPSKLPECLDRSSLNIADRLISSWNDPKTNLDDFMKYPDVITEVERHYRLSDHDEIAENIWHPYIIQAVADLLGRAMSGHERANFLEVTTSFLEKEDSACDTCVFPDPGKMSLIYADVEAKVESEQPWPFEHMFEQVSNLLADTRIVINAEELASAHKLERRNRLIDLSLGLQLFYQRALTGQRFSAAQLQSWSEWLRETRAVLTILEETGGGDEQYLDPDEKTAWGNAGTTIEQDPAVVQDAATAAALSSVLLPALGGGTTSADCLKARALFDFAADRNIDRFYAGLEFDPDEKATYKGLIEQMKARIESECE